MSDPQSAADTSSTAAATHWTDRIVALAWQSVGSSAWLRWGPWLCAAAAIVGGVMVSVASVRLLHVPFAIDNMEAGAASMVRRAVAGQPLYVAPSLDYIPFPYAPWGYHVAATVVKWMSLDAMAALRWVNLGGVLVTVVLVFALARVWRLSWAMSVVAAMWPLLCNEISGYFFAVAKPEGLLMALMVAAALAVAAGRSWPSAVLAGTLMGLAMGVKQSALPYGMVMVALLALTEWRRALVLGVAMAAVAWLLLGLPIVQGDTWMRFYLVDCPAHYPHLAGSPLLVPRGLLARGTLMMAAALLTAPLLWRRGERRVANHVLAVFVALVLPSGLLLTQGTYANSLMPAMAVCGVVGLRGAQLWLPNDRHAAPSARLQAGLVLVAVLVQILALTHNPGKPLPDAGHMRDWQNYVAWLKAAPGPVTVTDDLAAARAGGQRPWAADVGLSMLAATPIVGTPKAAVLRNELLSHIRSERPAAVVTFFYQQQMAQLEGYVWVGALNAVHGWGLTIGDASRSYQVFLREDLARGVRPSPDPVMARWQRGEQIGWPIATP